MKNHKILVKCTNSIILLMLFNIISCQPNVAKIEKLSIESLFTTSGYMGDGEYGNKYVSLEGAYAVDPYSPPSCIRIKYTFGPQTWAGLYWQNKPDNWGDKTGENYSKRGFTKITFWAKGENGTELIEFKSGGICNLNKKFKDSYEQTLGKIRLSRDWQQYEIIIKGLDLESVIGAFCWTASKDYNSGPAIMFYIDDIYFQ